MPAFHPEGLEISWRIAPPTFHNFPWFGGYNAGPGAPLASLGSPWTRAWARPALKWRFRNPGARTTPATNIPPTASLDGIANRVSPEFPISQKIAMRHLEEVADPPNRPANAPPSGGDRRPIDLEPEPERAVGETVSRWTSTWKYRTRMHRGNFA